MRDWNYFRWIKKRGFKNVFSIPMRDWNSKMLPESFFASTVFSIPMRDWNWSSLFRGMSPQEVFSIPMRDWNCDWTEHWVFRWRVFSIPMRDWNHVNQKENRDNWTFSAYLWGIETPVKRNWFGNERRFSAYLWGIETWVFMMEVSIMNLVFSIPMRDWNMKRLIKHTNHGNVFSIPMRDWNHRQPTSEWGQFHRFQHTYEGLKPACSFCL